MRLGKQLLRPRAGKLGLGLVFDIKVECQVYGTDAC